MSTATPGEQQNFPQAENPEPTGTPAPTPVPEDPPRDPGQGLPDPEKVGRAKFFVDLAERAVATYLESFVALLVVADKIDIELVTAAAVAAIPAGLSVVKAGLGRFLGDKKSAAFLPYKLLKG